MVKVKICGLRGEDAARACAEASVDLVGLNFVKGRRRAITAEHAARIAPLSGAERVGVFIDPSLEYIESVHSQVDLQWVQLHGDESPEFCAALAPRFSVIKVFAVNDGFAPERLLPYIDHVAAFLFDAPRAGSGEVFDWSRLGALPRARPFFLAGGLTADNVASAIAAVRPDHVDTASGIETGGRPDPARIKAFVQAVRSAS